MNLNAEEIVCRHGAQKPNEWLCYFILFSFRLMNSTHREHGSEAARDGHFSIMHIIAFV